MRNKWIPCLTILALLAGFLPAVNLTLADGPDLAAGLAQGDDFLISRATWWKEDGAVAYNDDDDEYLVVWTDQRGGIIDYMDIYGQFVSSAGVPRGDNFVIRDKTDHNLMYPDVAYDSYSQRYLVVWVDGTEYGVEGIVLNSDGSAYSAPFNVAVGNSDWLSSPSAACYAHGTSGTYAVAYERTTGSNVNIYARLVSVNGGTASPERAVCVATGTQDSPDIAVNLANGDFLIVWQDGRTATSGIYGRLFHPTGFPGTEFAVATPSEDVDTPAVAFSPDAGEWLVVFDWSSGGGDSQIRGRRVTAGGTPTGDGIHICDDSEDQSAPDVAYNTASDEFLVVWVDDRNSATQGCDIYGRRVNVSGSTIGDDFAICTAPDDQALLDVAASSSATTPGYLVAFARFGATPKVGDIDGQRVSTSGALEGPQFTISAPLNDQTSPAVACNSQDMEYLVVWRDGRAGNTDIYGQLVDRDGVLVNQNLVICSNASAQSWPDVAYNSATNQYLVVWQDERIDEDIYGQRVNADGSLDGGNFAIASSGAIARRHPSVTHNPINGEYFVVYTYNTESNNIRGRRVPASDPPTTAEIDIATGTAEQMYPVVACRALASYGGYLVIWRERVGTQDRDIRGRRLNPVGSLLGGVLDICTQADDQWSPASVAFSPDSDRYLVVWPDDRNSATQGRDIYGRQVGGTGTLYTERAISTAAQAQAPVAVAYSGGLGEYVVTWDDDRNAGTAPDLYAQRLSNSGALLDTTASVNELLFQYSGSQQNPALAWSDTEKQGLLVWRDERNGVSSHIYGLRLGTGDYALYLPLVIRND